MQRVYERWKALSTFWKIFIVILLLISVGEIYRNYTAEKLVSQYQEVISDTCNYVEPGLSEIYTLVNSSGMNYVTMLQRVRAAEDNLGTAERVLNIGTSEIDSEFRIETSIYEWQVNDLRQIIESSLSESIDIAIAQGDPENIASGRAREGLQIIQDRLSRVKEICK